MCLLFASCCVCIVVVLLFVIFFFKQKTAYEMRISDWSSDVCSSDLKGLDDLPFCMGVNFSLADIAVGCALSYIDLRLPDLDWRKQHGNLRRLDEKLSVRPSFVDNKPPKA